MAKQRFIVYYDIGAVVEIDTEATDVSELTEEEKDFIRDEACSIVETPDYGNIVDIIYDGEGEEDYE